MDTPDTHKPPSKGRRTKRECCTDLRCESGLRNNYFEGKRLTPEMFRIEQRYLLERRQLLNRAIHGWGVVYGYGIVAKARKGDSASKSRTLEIGPGLALDECGRELLQTGVTDVDLDGTIVLDKDRNRVAREKAFAGATQYTRAHGQNVEGKCWLLSAHYAEQCGGDVQIPDPCHCDHQEWDHTCETVRYSLRLIPCHECCDPFDCELKCECGTRRFCQLERAQQDPQEARNPKQQGEAPRDGLPFKRGGCQCLCDHLTHQVSPGETCSGRLSEIEEPCGHVWVDLCHGVPIACLEIVPDDCGGWTFGDEVERVRPAPPRQAQRPVVRPRARM